jgi:hypothetical protein
LEFQYKLLEKVRMTENIPIDYKDQNTKATKRRRVYEEAEQHTQRGGGCNCDGKKSKTGTGALCHGRSRCPCKIAGRACGFFCRCKSQECSNPNGTHNGNGVSESPFRVPQQRQMGSASSSASTSASLMGGGSSRASLAPTEMQQTGAHYRYGDDNDNDPDYHPGDSRHF